MKFRSFQTIRLALMSLRLHKLRSALTVLGIIFGVCSVIAMLAIGEGASHEVQQQIKQMGATNILVRSVRPLQASPTVGPDGQLLEYGLTDGDYDRLTTTIPTVIEALPVREVAGEIGYYHRAVDGRVIATTPAYQQIHKLRMHRGRFLTDHDMRTNAKVTVLAHEVARTLFPLGEALDQSVRVKNDYYRVIGVCAPRSPSAAVGMSLAAQQYDADVYLPLGTFRLRFGDFQADERASQLSYERVPLTQITMVVGGEEQVRATAAVARDLLARYHQQKDYNVVVPLELLEQAERTKRLFNAVLGSIGAISLLVGGIGIMNIMLATVTERTREIGIRRALGAKRRDITAQFLVEAAVLSSIGGLLGLALGVGLPYLITEFVAYFFDYSVPTIVTPWVLPLAFGVSVLVGIVFGLYPARHAARMDPVEALRHE